MEKYNLYLKKFKIALGILVVAIIVFGFLISKTFPIISKINDAQKSYKTASTSLVDAERKLENLKISKEKAEGHDDFLKAFFKPINEGVDTESAISDEFGEILQIMRENKIKARSLKFDPDPDDDNFVKHVSDKYYVCRVTADLIGTYSQFENFLRELFKHEHFLDISSVEITPYQKNKRILLVNLQIKLYAQKGSSSAVQTRKSSNNEDNNSKKTKKHKSHKNSDNNTLPNIEKES